MGVGVQDNNRKLFYNKLSENNSSDISILNVPKIKKNHKGHTVHKPLPDNLSGKLKAFKDSLNTIVFQTADAILDDFIRYSIEQQNVVVSKERCAFELLSIGVFWNNYSGASQICSKTAISAVEFLYKESEKTQWLKVALEPIRGALSTLFLIPYVFSSSIVSPEFDYATFIHLIKWLNAVGSYNEEIMFFSVWADFIKRKDQEEIEALLRKAAFIGQWFEIHSRKTLDPKTDHNENRTLSTENNRAINLFRCRKETECFRKLIAV
ncbi:MAG: hypothetical protein JW915_05855 [Chitinispirillaceae bacterium]|nr:hypothetical protein [Chitinispirillaceae bacterium]